VTIPKPLEPKVPKALLVNRVGKPLPLGRVDAVVADFVSVFTGFNARYKSKKPQNETNFIKKFLESVNIHASCALQRYLLSECPPGTVSIAPLNVDPALASVFIEPTGLDWSCIKDTLRSRSLSFIRKAFDEKLCGPPPGLLNEVQQGVKLDAPSPDPYVDQPILETSQQRKRPKANKRPYSHTEGQKSRKRPCIA